MESSQSCQVTYERIVDLNEEDTTQDRTLRSPPSEVLPKSSPKHAVTEEELKYCFRRLILTVPAPPISEVDGVLCFEMEAAGLMHRNQYFVGRQHELDVPITFQAYDLDQIPTETLFTNSPSPSDASCDHPRTPVDQGSWQEDVEMPCVFDEQLAYQEYAG
jgi:hypothetical protein